MTSVYTRPQRWRLLVAGAVGGGLAAALALAALTGVTVAQGGSPYLAANAVGAWLVRWLQAAEADAFGLFLPDASLGGIVVFCTVGAAVGALYGAAVDRLPEDHPVAWGVLLALALWVGGRWLIAPALNPVMLDVLPPEGWSLERWQNGPAQGVTRSASLIAANLVYGLALGGWVHVSRRAERGSHRAA